MSDNRKKPQRFVSKSYVISDDWAVSKIKAYLMGKGYEVKSKKSEDFEVDITAEKSGRVEYFEVETKTGYSFYNNETGSFLARKRKRKWESLSFWNVIVCREGVFFSNRHI